MRSAHILTVFSCHVNAEVGFSNFTKSWTRLKWLHLPGATAELDAGTANGGGAADIGDVRSTRGVTLDGSGCSDGESVHVQLKRAAVFSVEREENRCCKGSHSLKRLSGADLWSFTFSKGTWLSSSRAYWWRRCWWTAGRRFRVPGQRKTWAIPRWWFACWKRKHACLYRHPRKNMLIPQQPPQFLLSYFVSLYSTFPMETLSFPDISGIVMVWSFFWIEAIPNSRPRKRRFGWWTALFFWTKRWSWCHGAHRIQGLSSLAAPQPRDWSWGPGGRRPPQPTNRTGSSWLLGSKKKNSSCSSGRDQSVLPLLHESFFFLLKVTSRNQYYVLLLPGTSAFRTNNGYTFCQVLLHVDKFCPKILRQDRCGERGADFLNRWRNVKTHPLHDFGNQILKTAALLNVPARLDSWATSQHCNQITWSTD